MAGVFMYLGFLTLTSYGAHLVVKWNFKSSRPRQDRACTLGFKQIVYCRPLINELPRLKGLKYEDPFCNRGLIAVITALNPELLNPLIPIKSLGYNAL